MPVAWEGEWPCCTRPQVESGSPPVLQPWAPHRCQQWHLNFRAMSVLAEVLAEASQVGRWKHFFVQNLILAMPNRSHREREARWLGCLS